jgi:hypothetical protein
MLIVILLLGTLSQAKICFCQCGEDAKLCQCDDPPKLSINSGIITVSGQTIHLSGKLPAKMDHWFYAITCHTGSRLFDFSLWTIAKFGDSDNFYSAGSWNLQVSDSKDRPEVVLNFNRENNFYFWGNVTNTPGGRRIRVDNIVGFPLGIHGDGILREVPH